MNIVEAQEKVLKLLRLAASAPDSEEARTAASTACRLITEHGLLVMTPGDLVRMSTPIALPPAEATPAKKRRKRPDAKAIQETVTTAAETATTALDAAGRVAKAVNGFRNAIRGGA